MLERIITALVLVAVVLSCMFATQSHYPMFVLMIIAAGVAGYEWFKLMPRTTKKC
jgi:phosphatidate cytidylyltransferase